MRKLSVILLMIMISNSNSSAQQWMKVYQSGNSQDYLIDDSDTLSFSSDQQTLLLNLDGIPYSVPVQSIDSIVFEDPDDKTIFIHYSENSVSVINPLSASGVVVEANLAGVTVYSTSTWQDINYVLSGQSQNAYFKIYSQYRFNVILNGLKIKNPIGPAINIQSSKKARISMLPLTESILEDGANYTAAPVVNGISEDQEACFFSNGDLNFWGWGSLQIIGMGSGKHALRSDDAIHIKEGELTISSIALDAIHAKDGFEMSGGVLLATTSGNVVLTPNGTGNKPSYSNAVKTAGNMLITGGEITLQTTGIANQALSADSSINIQGGNLQITCSGNGATYTNSSGQIDAYHSTCIRSNLNFSLQGGKITLNNSGTGGKGIDVDGEIHISNDIEMPELQITTSGASITLQGGSSGNYDESKAIKANGAVTIQNGVILIHSADDAIKSDESILINGGNITISQSYESLESKIVRITGGTIYCTASNDALNTSMGVDGEANDGSLLDIQGGYIVINVSNGDGMDSNGNITMSGGSVIIHGPASGFEVGVDVNGIFTMSGGLLVASGPNSNMLEGPASSSSQRSVILKTNQSIPANTIFRIQKTDGTEVLTFAPTKNYNSIILSSALLQSGQTYQVYTGGSYSNGHQNGLYQGGTYSGGTLKTSFTSNAVTQTISF